MNYGAYDSCVNFVKDASKNVDFDGKYCLISVQTPETSLIKRTEKYQRYQSLVSARSKRLIDFNIGNAHGVCIPSTCTMDELTPVANKVLESYGVSILAPRRCTTVSEPEPLTYLQIVSL